MFIYGKGVPVHYTLSINGSVFNCGKQSDQNFSSVGSIPLT